MGEPLLNWRSVSRALEILVSPSCLGYGGSRITVSTSGIVPGIYKLKSYGVKLAISLHAVNNQLRDELVPINKSFSIDELLKACKDYVTDDEDGQQYERNGRRSERGNEDEDGNRDESRKRSSGRSGSSSSESGFLGSRSGRKRVTFEYVMLKGVNDSAADAKELCRLLHHYRIPSLVNLIPFNPFPGNRFECSSTERIYSFSELVGSSGIPCTIRWSKGADIMAACGQLADKFQLPIEKQKENFNLSNTASLAVH